MNPTAYLAVNEASIAATDASIAAQNAEKIISLVDRWKKLQKSLGCKRPLLFVFCQFKRQIAQLPGINFGG
jgi:hypothetical protein